MSSQDDSVNAMTGSAPVRSNAAMNRRKRDNAKLKRADEIRRTDLAAVLLFAATTETIPAALTARLSQIAAEERGILETRSSETIKVIFVVSRQSNDLGKIVWLDPNFISEYPVLWSRYLAQIVRLHRFSPSDARKYGFEVKPAVGKRLGVFATKDIKAGTKFFRESPLCVSTGGDWLGVEASIATMNTAFSRFFWALQNECHCGQVPCQETNVMKIWKSNSFNIPSKVMDEVKEYESHVYRMSCVYGKASLLNHSCIPNASYAFTEKLDVVFTATSDIHVGDEISISYVDTKKLPVKDRRALLSQERKFKCVCAACVRGEVVNRNVKEISESQLIPEIKLPNALRAFRTIDRHGKDILKDVNAWALDVFHNYDLHIRVWRQYMGIIEAVEKSIERFDLKFIRHVTSQITRSHSTWLKDCVRKNSVTIAEPILTDEAVAVYVKRLGPRIEEDLNKLLHFHKTKMVLLRQYVSPDKNLVSVLPKDKYVPLTQRYLISLGHLREVYRVSEVPVMMTDLGLYRIDEKILAGILGGEQFVEQMRPGQ